MTDPSDDIAIESILASGLKFPPRPDVLLELEYLNVDPTSDPAEYARIISNDPMLAGAMFRVANSPIFSLSSHVETLERAVLQIGTKNTMSVVRSESLRKALVDDFDNPLIEALWQRQLSVAELAVRAAKAANLRSLRPDLLYLLGIFHDCGVAILARHTPAYGEAYLQAGEAPDLVALDEANNSNHMAIGKLLATDWQLPKELVLAIRHHHQTDLASLPEAVRNMIALLQFAIHLHCRRKGADNPDWDEWREPVNQLLGMGDGSRQALEDELLEGST
jgi:HD-like signal output (HDOD) protein